MSIKALQESVKQTLNTINISISKIPNSKKPMFLNRITKLMEKYNPKQIQNDIEKMQSFYNELKFNMNFIKLSFPDLQNQVKKEEQIRRIKKQIQDEQKASIQQNKNNQQGQNKKELIQEVQLSQSSKVFLRQSLQYSAKSNLREQVEFSNWWQGNVDPENLRRHKNLLARQHFAGDYWKDRQKPISHTRQFLQQAIQTGKIPLSPQMLEKALQAKKKYEKEKNEIPTTETFHQQRFEYVKR